MNSARWTVVLMMGTAFAIFTVGRSRQNVELPDSTALWSWAGLTIALAVMVDIGATEQVASALSVAILVAILYLYGEQFFDWVNGKTSTNTERQRRLVIVDGKRKVV